MLVASVYLFNIINAAGASGTHGSYQQGNTCTDVRTRHTTTTQGDFPVVSYDYSTVGVAKNYLCAHVNELVHEEQAALKHLLVEEHGTAGLRGHHNKY